MKATLAFSMIHPIFMSSVSMLLAALAVEEPVDPLDAVQPVDGIVVDLWATDPMLIDPVAFCLDARGRVYVAETERQERGVEDSRSQAYWNLDDISLQSNADRLAMYQKWAHKFEGGLDHFTRYEDRIRLLEDTTGDGRADTSIIFSDGYNDALDGTGSGLLVNGADVYYTNIPHLWRLQDTDGDNVADVQESMFDGFGVRIALRGHDMHGLTWGPDGRLYWSIGDRGYNVHTPEGEHLFDPTSGAVFRCDPDGSNLEVFHTGLRNPQEIAFDDYGTLFTGDNNSDGGDRARLVHVAEGGQTGWRMEYQSLTAPNLRGPWNREGIWHERHEHQPAWVIPPIAHIASGPSGFVHYPGTGLDDRYEDHFFLCDFTGSPQHSRVLSFAVEPDGAGYTVADLHPFVTGILCTDVDFGWDGRMYVSDWVEGWYGNSNGRIFTLHDPRHADAESVGHAASIMVDGFDHRSLDELQALLAHADQRIRLQAQFAMARRGDEATSFFTDTMASGKGLERLHAIWGLGMLARTTAHSMSDERHPMASVLTVLDDPDREVRGQAAKVLGEAGYSPAAERLVELIFDEEPRVIYHATMAVGRLQHHEGLDAVTEMLWVNANEDALLRHAGVMALTWFDDRAMLLELSRDEFPAVRLATLLALRRMADPAIEVFLEDPDPLIAAEAARAINDLPIDEAMPALVDRIEGFRADASSGELSPPERSILWRAVNAAFRSGRPEDASAVADIALHTGYDAELRRDALSALAEWIQPSARDRVNGAYRPVDTVERDEAAWRGVLGRAIPRLAQDEDAELASAARELAASQDIALDDGMLLANLRDTGAPSRDRIASLRHLHRDKSRRTEVLDTALNDPDAALHGAALQLLAESDQIAAMEWIRRDLEDESIARRQEAIAVLGTLETPGTVVLLADLHSQAISRQLHSALHLEVQEAVASRSEHSMQLLNELREDDRFSVALNGGDADRGRSLVRYHAAAACLRCHSIEGHGGTSAPDLTDVHERLDRAALLQSIIEPAAVVAEGYGDVTAMPEMTTHLTPRQVRDIVEYLAQPSDERE